jgi:hypothetical protein
MLKRLILAATAALALSFGAACTTTPKGPEQTVYAAHGNYAAGLSIALQYKALPTCGPTVPPLCKDPKTLKEMQDADDKAFEALTTAQRVVRAGPGPQADQAATNAQKAIAEFRKQTSAVKVK